VYANQRICAFHPAKRNFYLWIDGRENDTSNISFHDKDDNWYFVMSANAASSALGIGIGSLFFVPARNKCFRHISTIVKESVLDILDRVVLGNKKERYA
jgi:hypothetical protein